MTTSVISKNKALPLVAHCYDSGWKFGGANLSLPTASGGHFKKTIPVLNWPTLKYSINAGLHPTRIRVAKQDSLYGGPALAIGDVITLNEQGAEGDASVLYSGILEDLPETLDSTATHELELIPFIVEAGLVPFLTNYTVGTDVATMVRNAVDSTKHLVWTTSTIPLTGVAAIFDFTITGTVLRAFEDARRMAGPNYYFYVDETGTVWFGNTSSASATYTVARGVDYQARKTVAPADKLRNYVAVQGGSPTLTKAQRDAGQKPIPLAVVYDDGVIRPGWPFSVAITAPSNVLGVRARIPNVRVPKLLDQTTLNNIATSIGKQLNRRQTSVSLDLESFGTRINLSRQPGTTLRYWEPNTEEVVGQSFRGSGGFSPNYAVMDVEVTATHQKVALTDVVP